MSQVVRSIGMVIPGVFAFFSPPPPAMGQAVCPDVVVDSAGADTALSLGDANAFHTTDREVLGAVNITVDIPESEVCIVTWDERTATGDTIPFYAIRLTEDDVVHVRQPSFTLRLKHGAFDPLDGALPTDPSLTADETTNVYIVQLATQTLDDLLTGVEARGAKVHKSLANHAHLVSMTPLVRDQVRALPYVRWVGPYHPAYRLEKRLLDEVAEGCCTGEQRKYSIMVFERGGAQQQSVAERISALGGTVHYTTASSSRFEATMTLDQVVDIAGMDEVMYIDIPGEIVHFMDNAREISGANYLAGLSAPAVPFTGTGVRGEVLDLGFRVTHDAFDPAPIVHRFNCEFDATHGTPIYGIIFGDDTNIDPPVDGAVGILPDGTGIVASNYVFDSEPGCGATYFPGGRYDHTRELVDEAYCDQQQDPNCPYDAVFQSSSWGTGRSTDYGTVAADLDLIPFDLDILICQAQGNCGAETCATCRAGEPPGEGDRCSGTQAWAKNVVSVGGFRHYNTLCDTDDDWASCTQACSGCVESWCQDCDPLCEPDDDCCTLIGECGPSGSGSIGPADDGRVKPDLAHFYDHIVAPCFKDDECYTYPCDGPDSCTTGSGCSYPCLPSPMGGTSAAAPITCAYFGLMFEMVHEGVFCSLGGGTSVFDSRPHAATAKALMINTASAYPFTQGSFSRDNQGWGIVDVKKLYDGRDKTFIIDEDVLLSPLETWTQDVTVDDEEVPLRITLVYTDPPGSPSASRAAVNDLDLKVTSPAQAVYWGNCGLSTDEVSTTCSAPSTDSESGLEILDTVENVFIDTPAAGVWTIEVIADDIAEDAHAGTATKDASFALVVTGATGTSACCNPQSGTCSEMTCAACKALGRGFRPGSTCATVHPRCPRPRQ